MIALMHNTQAAALRPRAWLPLLAIAALGALAALSVWFVAQYYIAPPTKQLNGPVIAGSAPLPLPVVPPNSLPIPVPPPPPAPVVSRVVTEQPVVFVTIDDGVWHPADAASFIADNHLPISAFLTTSMVKNDPGYFATLQRAGVSIANHTVTHPHMPHLSYTEQKDQICEATQELHRWYGVRPTLFRAPYGEYDTRTRQAAAACGIKYVVQWTVVLDHGKLRYQFTPGHLRAGDIVLLHFRPELKQDLEVLMRAAQERGLHLAQLQDYLP